MPQDHQFVLGIDLGTTNSACAVVQAGSAGVVRRGEDRIIPSMIAARADGSMVVGLEAKRERILDPVSAIYSAKRLIGRRFSSPEVTKMIETVPYKIFEGRNESVMVGFGSRKLSAVEVSSYVLKYLRQMAEEALGQRIRKCVISVPANFTDSQRSATRISARLAGLEVIRIINEPTAAALAYGYIEDMDRRIAVYDFGGGTFDITILEITQNVFEVLATSGEMFLGGDDLDEAILGAMLAQFEEEHGIDLREHPVARARLRSVAEELKIELSEAFEVSRFIEGVLPDQGKSLNFSLTETTLRDLIGPIVHRTVPVCEEAMKIAGIRPDQIDEIVLVGGTTRIPIVRETVRKIFDRQPQTSINPMSVVAVGAAIQGAALVGLLVPMADGGVSAPSMNATAVLLDVTPRSFGVRTLGGHVDRIIERNSVVPVEQTRLFTTTVDNQKYVRIEVCQGESPSFDDNTKLGEVLLSGIRSAARGEIAISVTFEINTDGLLEVRALDGQTGQEQTATMKVLGGMSAEDVEALISRAESEGLLGEDGHEGSVAAR